MICVTRPLGIDEDIMELDKRVREATNMAMRVREVNADLSTGECTVTFEARNHGIKS